MVRSVANAHLSTRPQLDRRRSKRYRQYLLGSARRDPPCAKSRNLSRTYHSSGGSFSAVSAPIFTFKIAFCSIFRNLQNILAEFSKLFEIFGKLVKVYKNSEKFRDFHGFPKNLQKFIFEK